MTFRTFILPEHIWNSSYDVPIRLLDILEEAIERDEPWACHLFEEPGKEVWTLITLENGEVYQWRNQELFQGTWVPGRQAMRYDEGEYSGLFNLEGRKIPEDEAEEDELAQEDYYPIFGDQRKVPRSLETGLEMDHPGAAPFEL